ncbi:unnamed protein product [Owenia fusiformis]|uniref:Uncharacterized protein n=1 Tax=Owenia fusiformis TaxID=6347 RepID=A0A8S4PIL9_OWEFU|nr:unnamed protein product [Owenia fusiformis]
MMVTCIVQALVSLLLFSSIGITSGCRCATPHPQEAYCSSSFVILCKVMSQVKTGNPDDINDGYKIFTVKVLEDYKDLGWTGMTKEIYTAPHGGACGAFLDNDKKNILSGTFYKGTHAEPFPGEGVPYISLCGYNPELSTVPKAVLKGFKKLYKQHCECQICSSDCKLGNCYLPYNSKGPGWCYRDAVCQLAWKDSEGNAMCMWNLPKQWWKCVSYYPKRPRED